MSERRGLGELGGFDEADGVVDTSVEQKVFDFGCEGGRGEEVDGASLWMEGFVCWVGCDEQFRRGRGDGRRRRDEGETCAGPTSGRRKRQGDSLAEG